MWLLPEDDLWLLQLFQLLIDTISVGKLGTFLKRSCFENIRFKISSWHFSTAYNIAFLCDHLLFNCGKTIFCNCDNIGRQKSCDTIIITSIRWWIQLKVPIAVQQHYKSIWLVVILGPIGTYNHKKLAFFVLCSMILSYNICSWYSQNLTFSYPT